MQTIVQFPGNLSAVEDLAALRQVSTTTLPSKANYLAQGGAAFGDGAGGIYAWDPAEVAADDGVLTIRPADRTPLQAGRFRLAAGAGGEDDGGVVGDNGIRNEENATIAAAKGDGAIVLLGGLFYEVDSSLTGDDSATSDLNVDGLKPYGEVHPEHFGAIPDNSFVCDSAFIRALAYLAETGGSLYLRAGLYKLTTMLTVPFGIGIRGIGRAYSSPGGVSNFSGSWLIHAGTVDTPLLDFFGVQFCDIADFGIFCSGGSPARHAIRLGSANTPATKFLTFERLTIVNADRGVIWGRSGEFAELEQVDDITFRDIAFIVVGRGFVIDAPNAADYSLVERIAFDAVVECAFELITPGFMRISECAAGLLNSGAVMFKVTNTGPDQVIISSCQSEAGGGKFITYNATNDQGALYLLGNVINQPVEITGVTRIVTQSNYMNSTVALTGFVRWSGRDNIWLGVYGQPSHAPQVTVSTTMHFYDEVLPNASNQFGSHIPQGMRIRTIPTDGGYEGIIATRAGVRCANFPASTAVGVGEYYKPATDNTYAYLVTVAGTTAASEPTWPTTLNATVTSGGATFKNIGQSVILKGSGAIQA